VWFFLVFFFGGGWFVGGVGGPFFALVWVFSFLAAWDNNSSTLRRLLRF